MRTGAMIALGLASLCMGCQLIGGAGDFGFGGARAGSSGDVNRGGFVASLGPAGVSGVAVITPDDPTGHLVTQAVAFADDSAFVAGEVHGTDSVGDFPLPPSAVAPANLFIANYAESLNWVRTFPITDPTGNASVSVSYLSRTANGDLIVAGTFSGRAELVFGAAELISEAEDGFGRASAAIPTPRIPLLWAVHFTGPGIDRIGAVHVDDDTVNVAGDFQSMVTWLSTGGGLNSSSGESGGGSIFAGSIAIDTGTITVMRTFSATLPARVSAVAADETGFYLAGDFAGELTLSGTTLTNPGDRSLFVTKLVGNAVAVDTAAFGAVGGTHRMAGITRTATGFMVAANCVNAIGVVGGEPLHTSGLANDVCCGQSTPS
jgi:hypothetical protein